MTTTLKKDAEINIESFVDRAPLCLRSECCRDHSRTISRRTKTFPDDLNDWKLNQEAH
jgi:hypothetical protein